MKTSQSEQDVKIIPAPAWGLNADKSVKVVYVISSDKSVAVTANRGK
jgi:hypothetical protein